MSPKATIVIPLKRQKDAWLDQCVRSALEQSVPCEVLVVTAADTPASNLDVISHLRNKHTNLLAIPEESPGNFPAAINLGIRCAGSGRVGLLLSDDWLSPDAVENCLSLQADIVCTGHTVYYSDGETTREIAGRTLTLENFLKRPTLEAKADYLEHFFLFRKEAVLETGGLDESLGNFPGIDDYDLIWTLLERGATVGIVEKRLYNYRDHDGERLTLSDATQAAQNLEKILRKHGVDEAGTSAIVHRASRWFGRSIRQVLAEEAR